MVEGRQAHALTAPGQSLASQHRLQHHLVAHVGQQCPVHGLGGLLRDAAARAHPQVLATGALLGGAQVEIALHMPEVEGRRAPQETRHRMVDGTEDLQCARQVLRARN